MNVVSAARTRGREALASSAAASATSWVASVDAGPLCTARTVRHETSATRQAVARTLRIAGVAIAIDLTRAPARRRASGVGRDDAAGAARIVREALAVTPQPGPRIWIRSHPEASEAPEPPAPSPGAAASHASAAVPRRHSGSASRER